MPALPIEHAKIDTTQLPRFSAITPENIVDAVQQAIDKCKATAESVVKSAEVSYANVIELLEEADDELSKLWSPISHMNSVVSSDELREAHDACLPLLSEYGTYIGQHNGLCKLYIALQKSDEYQSLSQASKKLVDNGVRDFTLSGVALPDDKKAEYAKIRAELSELGSTFSNNVMDATLNFTYYTEDEAELSGLPDSVKAAAKQTAMAKERQGYLFTLDIPSYLPVMMYADNENLRETMYRAYTTKASEFDTEDGKFDNTKVIERTLALRQKLSALLDFENYADYALQTKMAESASQVISFLEDLAEKSKPQAQAEIDELRAFAEKEYGKSSLNAWDYPYYSEKLKQAKYAVSDEELRPYFPVDKVLTGLFDVVSRLYGIDVVEIDGVDTWHEDARFFEIRQGKELRGCFYLDLFARAKKRGGAWMDECRVKRITADNRLQVPVAYLTCNFNGPVDGKPALFTHDEVVTMFHEFGHGIHHMLTKITVGGVSGINGVAWDAVELPSQFLENWCWQPEALAFLSGHYETGEALPKDLLDKLLAAKNYQSAMQMLRQLEFALFDFSLHMQTDTDIDVQAFLNVVRDKIAVLVPPAFNRFQNSFSHIFAGGYAAGYYSYKWAEVLSSDAFSRFEEEGIFNQQTGQDFLTNILEKGGSDEPMNLFKAFRGREPSIQPLLRHSGIGEHDDAA
ncbi:oligopeptidase A [Agaribacter marinus]|uniref:oligopeptidase A n=1 Tax=Agaribacter marinus TaxID=1431249 RepID=A0AA37WLS7_9ALTE|nr:oligopeptidase A [Agaribacter marinus]GLR72410.1 oligopeptidase A [Agaribacter marinus]